MKRRILMFAVALAVASSAHAQQPASAAPLSDYLRLSYAALSKNLAAVVETMPEQDFGFRPDGAVKEVRTFGEIVSHLVLVNAFVCAMGGTKPDSSLISAASIVDKRGLVTLMSETNARCTAYLAKLTDAALTEGITGGSAPRQIQTVRGNSIMFAIAHSNEHYGNLVTYLRAKGLVPPVAAVQAVWFTLGTPAKH